MMFGTTPFEKNDPRVSPGLSDIGSGCPERAEHFFVSNSASCSIESTAEFKQLLAKMLAIDPLKRVPLETLLREDPWVANGPNSSPMTITEYT